MKRERGQEMKIPCCHSVLVSDQQFLINFTPNPPFRQDLSISCSYLYSANTFSVGWGIDNKIKTSPFKIINKLREKSDFERCGGSKKKKRDKVERFTKSNKADLL